MEGGFLAYDDQADCLRKVDDLTGNTLDDIYPVCLQKSAYSSIDGCIKSAELSSYIAAVHPTWTLAYTTIMQDYSKRRMNTNSYYYQEKLFEDGNPEGSYSEGNCGPNAMYSFLYNLPTVSSPSGTNYQYCNNLINGRRVTPRRQYFLDGLDFFPMPCPITSTIWTKTGIIKPPRHLPPELTEYTGTCNHLTCLFGPAAMTSIGRLGQNP